MNRIHENPRKVEKNSVDLSTDRSPIGASNGKSIRSSNETKMGKLPVLMLVDISYTNRLLKR